MKGKILNFTEHRNIKPHNEKSFITENREFLKDTKGQEIAETETEVMTMSNNYVTREELNLRYKIIEQKFENIEIKIDSKFDLAYEKTDNLKESITSEVKLAIMLD